MVTKQRKVRVHVKNNYWNTPEATEIFTITPERFAAALARHPDIADSVDVFIDWDVDHFAQSMRTAEILVTWDLPTENLAKVAPHLRMIHIIGAGVEHLYPIEWLPETVSLVNSKGAHAEKAGEFGLMAILMLHNNMPTILANQAKSRWESLYAASIVGRTLLIVGVGSIGGAVAKMAKLVGLRVLGITRHGRGLACVDEMGTAEQLDAMLPRADFVFVAAPATSATRDLLDRRRLGLLKSGCGLINVGRQSVVDYEALADLLISGHLSGAILDVFDIEPLPPESRLWNIPGLIVTPHVSADSADSYITIVLEMFFNNLRRYLRGEPLQNIVRPELGY